MRSAGLALCRACTRLARNSACSARLLRTRSPAVGQPLEPGAALLTSLSERKWLAITVMSYCAPLAAFTVADRRSGGRSLRIEVEPLGLTITDRKSVV